MSYLKLPEDIKISFLEKEEGFTNKFVYPGGVSGPTVGNGIDIGNLEPSTLDNIFSGLDPSILAVIKTGYGLKGKSAEAWVARNKNVAIPKDILKKASEYLYGMFWSNVVKRFPGIEQAGWSTRTAVFSCCYNRGYGNKALAPWIEYVAKKQYKAIADSLWNMQQDHQLPGIRTRRRKEAKLIYDALGIKPPQA